MVNLYSCECEWCEKRFLSEDEDDRTCSEKCQTQLYLGYDQESVDSMD